MGDYSGTLKLQEQTLQKSRKSLGDDHPRTLTMMYNLALVLNSTGDHKGAKALLKEALPKSRAALGNDHSLTQVIRQAIRPQQSFFERVFSR